MESQRGQPTGEVPTGEVPAVPRAEAVSAWERHFWMISALSPQAANTDIGWALGFMLNLTNTIPTEAPEQAKGHRPSLWAGAVSVIVLAIVTGLVAVFLQCCWKTK